MTLFARAREALLDVALVASTAANHLVEDPLDLALQAGRRLPRGVVGGVARVLSAGPSGAGALRRAYAAWLTGHADEAAVLVEQAAARRGARTGRLLAELAVRVGRADLLEGLDGTVPVQVRARAAWARGDMTRAEAMLEADGRHGRLLSRYRAETGLLASGTLPRSPDRGPRRRGPAAPGDAVTALHVLTNSLPHTQSGYALRSHAVLTAQAAEGVHVAAVTRIGYPVSVGVVSARHEDTVDGVAYHRVIPARMPPTVDRRLEQQARRVERLARELRPTVLHTTTNYLNAVVTRDVAQAVGVPWVYEVRGLLEDTWVAGRPSPAERAHAEASERYAALRARETATMLAADHVVTLSDTMRSDLVARGIPAARITVVPNGVDAGLLRASLAAPDARAAVGLDRDGVWVGTVSSLVDYEGLDTLVDAIAVVRRGGLDVRGCIVGDGVSRSALERRAAALGLSEHVHFPGRVPRERAALYHQALDVFAVPRRDVRVSRMVTPLKPVEAMACGRAVLASDLPALAEIVGRPGTGLLAPAGDVQAWAARIERLATDAATRATLGASGRRFAAGRTWTAAGRAYRELYEELGR